MARARKSRRRRKDRIAEGQKLLRKAKRQVVQTAEILVETAAVLLKTTKK